MPLEPKNILIIKPSAIGDIIQALPALSALRKSFPNAHISWFVRKEFAQLIEGHPYLNEIILFDRKFLGKAWYNPKAFSALISLIRKLKKGKFDIIFDFQGLFRTAGFAWLSGSKHRYGMSCSRELSGIFYTKKIHQDNESIHLVDYYLKIVTAAGATQTAIEFKLPLDTKAVDSVERLLFQNKVNKGNYTVFVPGSAHADKCWPVDKFAELADKISNKYGYSIAAVGTADERILAERIDMLSKAPIVNLAGKTNIKELRALLNGAKLVVSNDTGPGHIAAALHVPVVLIFGRSNPARVAPYGREHSVAAVEPNSRGFKADSTNPQHHIAFVTVEEVFQKVRKQFEQKA